MRICIGQINTTPGDFSGNRTQIIEGIDRALAEGADLIVFPELTVPGYLSQDLVYHSGYVDKNLQELQNIVSYSADVPGLFVVLGYIDRNQGTGKPYRNMAAVICEGKIVATYQKQLLPFYDVFDELRYFQPGSSETIVTIAGKRVGIAICEDLWNDKGGDDYSYENNPLERYRSAGVDVLVSLNSSPYVQGKSRRRIDSIRPGRDGMAIVYVNQIGGQDELVFDGQSFVAKGDSIVYLNAELFRNSFDVVDIDDSLPVDNQASVDLEDALVLGLRDYVQKSGFQRVVLGSSGGVDSAVVCMLACRAVGPENVHAIRLPSIYTSESSVIDARQLHANLGCWDYEMPVEHERLTNSLNAQFQSRALSELSYNAVADENIQARLRDIYIMHFSNAYGAMPLSTGNKTEAGCGYYTHFDMNFSYAPIKDIYKFEVVSLARRCVQVPQNIWKKPPSAELSEGQIDEDSLLPYYVLDPVVMAYVEAHVTDFQSFSDWCRLQTMRDCISSDHKSLLVWLERENSGVEYQRIVRLIGQMEFKRRQTCPGTKVSSVAFGIGRRVPIVEKWF